MHYVPRVLDQTIRRAMSTFPAVLVTGARQTGKTTLLRTEFGGEQPQRRPSLLLGDVSLATRWRAARQV
jgi:predicted AAA+ superfamily ATPase